MLLLESEWNGSVVNGMAVFSAIVTYSIKQHKAKAGKKGASVVPEEQDSDEEAAVEQACVSGRPTSDGHAGALNDSPMEGVTGFNPQLISDRSRDEFSYAIDFASRFKETIAGQVTEEELAFLAAWGEPRLPGLAKQLTQTNALLQQEFVCSLPSPPSSAGPAWSDGRSFSVGRVSSFPLLPSLATVPFTARYLHISKEMLETHGTTLHGWGKLQEHADAHVIAIGELARTFARHTTLQTRLTAREQLPLSTMRTTPLKLIVEDMHAVAAKLLDSLRAVLHGWVETERNNTPAPEAKTSHTAGSSTQGVARTEVEATASSSFTPAAVRSSPAMPTTIEALVADDADLNAQIECAIHENGPDGPTDWSLWPHLDPDDWQGLLAEIVGGL